MICLVAGRREPGTRRWQAWVEKHITNPPVRAALRLGVAPRAFALLETTGRRSGRRRLTPVGNGLEGNIFWLVSERDHAAGYVRNLVSDPYVRLKVGRRWYSGRATVLPEDDGMARRVRIDHRNGVVGRLDGVVFRANASSAPLTVRIDLNGGEDR